jgi:hypothetical protein
VRYSFDMRASDVGALKELLQRVKKSGGGGGGANGEAAVPWRVDEQVCMQSIQFISPTYLVLIAPFVVGELAHY